MQKSWAKEQEQYQRKTRLSDGLGDVQGSTKLERDAILEKFKTAKMTTKVRQKEYKDIAEKEMYGNHQDVNADTDTTDGETSQASTSALSDMTIPTSPSEQSFKDEDAAFERDLQLAKQLSIAEQSGYERGLASRAAIP
jgi:sterol 3beta-glucosyltransferase